jgi:hypothetical protein
MTHKLSSFFKTQSSAHQSGRRSVTHVVKPKAFQVNPLKSRQSLGGSKGSFYRLERQDLFTLLVGEHWIGGLLPLAEFYHFLSQSRCHFKRSHSSAVSFIRNSQDGVVIKVHILNRQVDHFNRTKSGIESQNQQGSEMVATFILITRGQQCLLLASLCDALAFCFFLLVNQWITIAERATANPSALNGYREHAPEDFKFAVDASNRARPRLRSFDSLAIDLDPSFSAGGLTKSCGLESGEVAIGEVSDSFLGSEVLNQRVGLVAGILPRAHPGFLNSLVVVLGLYCVVVFVVVGKLLEGYNRALNNVSFVFNFFQQILDVVAGLLLCTADRLSFLLSQSALGVGPGDAGIEIPVLCVPETSSSSAGHKSRFHVQICKEEYGISMSHGFPSIGYNKGVLSGANGRESEDFPGMTRGVTTAGKVLLTSGSQVRVLLGSVIKKDLSVNLTKSHPDSTPRFAAKFLNSGGVAMRRCKTFLYAVRMLVPGQAQPIKVGFSSRPEHRRQSYAQGPYPCQWLGVWSGSLKHEAAFHARFAHLRLKGEWFLPDNQFVRVVTRNIVNYQKARDRRALSLEKQAREREIKRAERERKRMASQLEDSQRACVLREEYMRNARARFYAQERTTVFFTSEA